MRNTELNIIFNNPNDDKTTIEFLCKLFIEVSRKKVDSVIMESNFMEAINQEKEAAHNNRAKSL